MYRLLKSGAFAILLTATATALAQNQNIRFTEVASQAGLDYEHGYFAGSQINEVQSMAGGVAVGDFDGDGWLDLYVVRGDLGPNLLFRNLGNGTFQEVGAVAGVGIWDGIGSGPAFLDFDGDRKLDLFIGGVERSSPKLFRNLGDGTFRDFTRESGIFIDGNTFSTAYGDFDRDGDLDLFMSHWIGVPSEHTAHLWRNDGQGNFTPIDDIAGIEAYRELDFSFTPNFTDINRDGWPDLLVTGDFGTSQIFVNNGDGSFSNTTSDVITDENGMGSAIGDFDNDGDFDWFVSSIYNPIGEPTGPNGMTGFTGNRLYRNLGDGTFEDATSSSGVRIGWWGWGATFADLNNDGWLDLVHTNGFPIPDFEADPTVVFLANGDGTFRETSLELGISDTGQGRGLVSLDFDRDGDQDILITNNSGPPLLYRNDGGNQNGRFLNIRLWGKAPNTSAIGARITVRTGGLSMIREVRCNNNYVSHQPAEVHFGVADALKADIEVWWPNGETTFLTGVATNQFLVINREKTVLRPFLEGRRNSRR